MKRILKAITLLIVMLSIFLWIFIFTEPGLQLLIKTGERLSQGKLRVDETVGKLGDSFTITGLSYSDTGLSLEIEQIFASWHPLALFRGEFHLRGLSVEGVKLVTSAEEEKTSDRKDGITLPEVTLPMAMLLKRIEIKDIEIVSGSDPITKIDRAVLEVDGRRDEITINVLELKAKEYEISLSGSIGMHQNWPAEIAGEWLVKIPDSPKLTGSCSLSGSFIKGKLKLDLTAPFVAGIYTDYSLADIIKWQSVLVANGVNPGLFAEEFPGDLDMEAAVNGQFEGENISADIDLKRIEGELRAYPVWLKSKMRFANSALEITEILVKSRSSKLVASGTLASDLDLDFDLSSDNIGDVLPSANGQVLMQGSIGGTQQLPTLKASIQGENMEGQGVAIGSLSATVEGAVHSKGTIDAEIVLTDVEYNENKVDETVLQLSGGLENHQVKLRLQQKEKELSLDLLGKVADQSWVGEVKDLFISFVGDEAIRLEKPALLEVSSKKAVLGDLCLLHDGGKACLAGQWLEGKWQAGAELLDFDPGYFSKDWPGTIDGKLIGQGDLSENGGTHHIELQSLSGNLKGKPLSGNGFINVEKSTLSFRDFFLRLGQASLAVEGIAGDTFDLRFEVAIPDIAGFVPDSAGSFSLEGSLKGDREAPVIHLSFDVHNGKFANITVAEVSSGRTDIDLSREGQIFSDINVSGVTTEFLDISSGSVQVNGTTGKHELQLELSTSEGDVSLKGEGGYDSSWNGALSKLSLLSKKYGEWGLDGDAEIVLGAEDKRVKNFCFGGTKAGICVDASYGLEKNWKLGVEVKSFDFSLLNDIQITTIPMEGSLQGTFLTEGQDNTIAKLDAEYSVPHLLLSSTFEEETLTYSFEQNSVQLHLIDDSLKLDLQSQFQGNGNLNGVIKVSGVSEINGEFADNPLEGDLDLRINDLSFVTILSNSLVKPQGRIDGDLKISGSIAKPQIKGDLKLREGGIEVPQFGINVKDLEVKIDGGQDGVIFNYSGKSGPGELVGEGSYIKNDNEGWQLTTEISGSDFELIATEEYQIRVDPELKFETDQGSTTLRGELRIPYARISLEGGDGSVSPSDDVVFVDDLDKEQQEKKSLETELTVILGDDVKIDGFGLKSNLTGQLELKDVPGKTLTATGELVVKDGHFSLYSNEMEINRGRLLFTGGPVDDPKVDVVAQRTVDKKVVGVNVSGTVSDLEVQLFSDPVMEESEILSYIVMGAGGVIPVDQVYLDDQKDSENMSIVVGKNLTEDLFIGYDHKFSDSAGEFKIKYKLGYGFSVETSSSVEAMSGDIFYSLER